MNSEVYWDGEFEMDLKIGNSYSDIALLKPIKSRFMHKSRDRKGKNECILSGTLRNDKDVPVTVIGCPFSDAFQVTSYFTPFFSNTFSSKLVICLKRIEYQFIYF